MWALIDVAVDAVGHEDENTADEIRRVIRNYIRQYGFLLQAAPFVDKRMHMEYNFCVSLIRYIDAGHDTPNFDISDKVALEEFDVEKGEEHTNEGLTADPEVRIAKGTGTGLNPDQYERLSRIIDEWNARYGTHFDAAIAAGSVISLNNMLKEDPRVKQSARVNSKADFRNTVNDQSEDALVRGYDQNEEWYGFLLNNEEARKQLVGILVDGMYHTLHDANDE